MPGTRKVKICATCGKAEGANWAYHWRTKHPGAEVKELLPYQTPSHPLNFNYGETINNKLTVDLIIESGNK